MDGNKEVYGALNTNSKIYEWNAATSSFATNATLAASGGFSYCGEPAVYDVNKNGYPDIIAVSSVGPVWQYEYEPNSGTYASHAIVTQDINAAYMYATVGVSDIDGDGFGEIFYGGTSSGNLRVLKFDGNGFYTVFEKNGLCDIPTYGGNAFYNLGKSFQGGDMDNDGDIEVFAECNAGYYLELDTRDVNSYTASIDYNDVVDFVDQNNMQLQQEFYAMGGTGYCVKGQNLLLGQTNLTAETGASVSNSQIFTDGIISTYFNPRTSLNTADYTSGTAGKYKWVNLLLSSAKTLGKLKLWQYYNDQRAFDDTNILVTANSDCATGFTTIFDAAPGGADKNYTQQNYGKEFFFTPRSVRCVRISGSGSNLSNSNVFAEFQGFESTTDCNWNIAARASRGAQAGTVIATKMTLAAPGNQWSSGGTQTTLFTQGHYVWPINISIVGATEYASDENVQIVVYAENDDEVSVSGAACDVNIYYPDGSLFVTKGSAGEIANTGVYRYSATAPATEGIYIARAQCSSGTYTAFDVHTFHVAGWANIIGDINSYVWNYSGRTLTDYNMGTLPLYVWSGASARTLSDYNMATLPAYLWGYSSKTLTDYNFASLPNYVWGYSSRQLTDYNMGTLPAFIWSNPTRSLTTLGIEEDFNIKGSKGDGYLSKISAVSYDAALVATPTIIDSRIQVGQFAMFGNYAIYNGFLTFDTSIIGSDENILSAKLGLKMETDLCSIDFNILVYHGDGSTCWGNDGLQASDWNSCVNNGIYDGNLISTEKLPAVGNYVTMPLSSNAINKDGNTQFELISSRYLSKTPAGDLEYVVFFSAETAGSEPYLEIKTYNPDMNLYSLWYFTQRTLTDYNQDTLPAYVWSYASRTLTDYNFANLPDWIWRGASTRTLTDYNMSTLPAYVWGYSTRTLSDYNMSTLPAYVWTNPARTLTTADINAYAVWNYVSRSLTDYNMATLPAYVWVYPTRGLTDYNFTTLPEFIWSSSARTLTDYNQSLMFSYLRDINRVVYDVNGKAWISAADVWAYSTRSLTDYNMSTLPAFVWSGSVRNLTDYNMGTLPAYIWGNATRTLTDYNMSTLPAYLWVYPTRSLTDYNMSTLPAFIWSNPTRSLTTLDVNGDLNVVGSNADGALTKSCAWFECTYSDALVATPSASTSNPDLNIGQYLNMGPGFFYLYNGYLTFNTSSIAGTVVSAELGVKLKNDYSGTDFNLMVFHGNGSTCWGNDGLQASDWNSCVNYGTYDGNLLSTEKYVDEQYVTMDIPASAINKDGNTQFELISSRYYAKSQPLGQEFIGIHSGDSAGNEPYLQIVTTHQINADYNLFAIWNYASRALTDYNMSTLPAYVWVSSNRSLTDYNMSTLPAWLWSANSRSLTDYNMVNLPAYLWGYSNRTLTDYNQSLMFSYLEDINAVVYDINGRSFVSAADIWAYATRGLTDYNMNALPAYVWSGSVRNLTDYNMGTLPAYLWGYSNRALTDYNMSTLPDYLWVYNTRTLTDYNMSSLPAYVWSNPTRSLTTLGIEQDRNFVGSKSDGYLQKIDITGFYNNALTATPTLFENLFLAVGQVYEDTPMYSIANSYLTFDTSVLGNDENILSVNLGLKLNSNDSDADFNILVYHGDGNASGNSCWGNTGLAATDWNSCYYRGVYDGNLISTEKLPAVENYIKMSLSPSAVNKDGNTQFELTSSRYKSRTAPSGYERVLFYSGDSAGNEPYLEVKTFNPDMNLYSIWYFAQRTLTDYNMSTLPAYVWVSSNRSLTDYNMSTLPAWLWSADSRSLTDYNMVNLPAYLWGYSSRTLTDYNQSLMYSYLEDINVAVYDINNESWITAADVWVYSSRALTDYNFSTLPAWLWTGTSNRTLTDYNLSALPAYVWSNPARTLTDYNMSTLPDYMWVYSSRSLTDYNMSTLPAYVWSNPSRELTTADINAWAVWNFAQRALTDYNMSTLPAYLWVYPTRTLSDYNQSLVYAYLADLNSGDSNVGAAIWAYASRSLTDYNMAALPAYVWAYNTRTLSDYNMGALPAYIWSNPSRELTTRDINAFAVWNFAQRALTDYNMGTLPAYIWVYPNRELTDYNFTTIPDYIWSGATVRTLTDYNQSGLISYLADINVTVADINGQAWVKASDIWAYSTRTLSDYNFSTLPDWVWDAQVRELTTADINAFAVWNYASRLLSDYNQGMMWSYLSDINVTVIDINGRAYVSAADLWNYGTRSLTDYNQAGTFRYLVDINSGIASISDVIGVDSFRASGKTMYRYLDDTNSLVGAIKAIVLDINAIVLRIDNNFADYNLGTVVTDIAKNYGAIIDVNTAVANLDMNSGNQAILDRLDENVLPDLDLIYNKVKDYPYNLTCNTSQAASGGSHGAQGLTASDRLFIADNLNEANLGLLETIGLLQLNQSKDFSSLFSDANRLVSLVEDVQNAQGLSNEFETSVDYGDLPDGLVGMKIRVSNPFDFALNKKFIMDLPAPLASEDVVGNGGANVVKMAGKWVVAKSLELGPKQSGEVFLSVKNAWKREFERVLAIPSMADGIVGGLDGTGYYSQAVTLQNDINEKYAVVSDAYKAAANANQLVAAYNSVLPLMQGIEGDYAELQALAGQSSGLNAMGMAVMGGQVSSTWGIVLVVLMGVFVLLGAIYVIWKMNLMHKKEADVSSMVQTTILKELIRMNRGIDEQGIVGEELAEERLKAESLKGVNEEMVRELKTNIMASVTQDVLKSLAAEKLSGLEKEAVEKTSSETEKAKNLLGKLEDNMKTGVVGRLKADLQRELERELREEMHDGLVSEEKNLKKELEEELMQEFGLGADAKGPAAKGPVGRAKKRGRPKGK